MTVIDLFRIFLFSNNDIWIQSVSVVLIVNSLTDECCVYYCRKQCSMLLAYDARQICHIAAESDLLLLATFSNVGHDFGTL